MVYPCGKGSSTLGYDPYTYEVPATVDKIRPCAFAHVEGFTSVKMSSPLKEIGEDAFNACRYLETVTIPSTVNKIADGAFSGSIQLTAINVESGNTTYSSADGVLYNADQTELVGYPGGKQGPYTTLPTTKTIRTRAFYYAAGITKLTLTPGVEEIGTRVPANIYFQEDGHMDFRWFWSGKAGTSCLFGSSGYRSLQWLQQAQDRNRS